MVSDLCAWGNSNPPVSGNESPQNDRTQCFACIYGNSGIGLETVPISVVS
jgi:hypothetical protein